MKFVYYLFFLLIFGITSSCTIDSYTSESIEDEETKTVKQYINDFDESNLVAHKLKILQKLEKFVDQNFSDSSKVDKLEDISLKYYDLKKYNSFRVLNKKALKIALKISDSIRISRCYDLIGVSYRKEYMLDSAYLNFYKSKKIYERLYSNKSFKEAITFKYGRVLLELAKILRSVKDYSESEDLTIKALEKFKESEDNTYIPMCYTSLGISAKYTNRFHESIDYHLKSIESAIGTEKFLQYQFSGYNNIGVVYKNLKKYEKAIEYYNKALYLEDFTKKNPQSYARVLDNLGYVKFLSNKDNTESLLLFDKAIEIRDSVNDPIGLSTNYLHYAEYYQSHNNFKKSKYHAEKVVELAPKVKSNEELLQAYQLLSEVSEPKTGLEYAQKYIALNDSLINEERLYRDKFARIRFETDQKEQQIIKVQNQNTVYLLGMLLLLSLIGFALFFFRQRTKYLAQQNKIVQTRAAYETETRISKRLHDELGNDIFQVMLQYQTNPHDPEIVNRLNKTYNKARDISRENSEFEIDETYGEELTDMLQNYTNNGLQLILRGLDKLEWDNFSSTVKIAIYRVLQELMTNMQKHSQASLVALIFAYDNKTLTIKYSDNGIGIPAEQLTSKNGLRNTEKRIQAIHGTLIFESEKDQGFKAEIKIPIE